MSGYRDEVVAAQAQAERLRVENARLREELRELHHGGLAGAARVAWRALDPNARGLLLSALAVPVVLLAAAFASVVRDARGGRAQAAEGGSVPPAVASERSQAVPVEGLPVALPQAAAARPSTRPPTAPEGDVVASGRFAGLPLLLPTRADRLCAAGEGSLVFSASRGLATCAVAGQRFPGGSRVRLPAGEHTLHCADASGALRKSWRVRIVAGMETEDYDDPLDQPAARGARLASRDLSWMRWLRVDAPPAGRFERAPSAR